ncbi:hypothetical protein [Sphaerisporangium album]|uniref:hypothetical protein n=1 Tax=Sphaerisporangium album TaxID=509200 RepID=UPI0011C08028|nr:hypothetical protein [Sphaerisporangium album]
MNTGEPPTGDLREHYRQLRRSQSWLDVAMCWTVVVPDSGKALNLNQIATRLSGDTPHQLHDPAPLSAIVPYDGEPYPVLVDWYDSAAILFELTTSDPVPPYSSDSVREHGSTAPGGTSTTG